MIGRPGLIGCRTRPLQHLQIMREIVMVAVDANLDRDDAILVLVDDADS